MTSGMKDQPLIDKLATRKVSVAVSSEPVNVVEDKYLSVCMDIGQIAEPTRFWNPSGSGEIVGRPSFNFERGPLIRLTAALAPAYLRIGGTEADRAYYQLEGELEKPPPPFRSVLHARHLQAIQRFAREVGFEVCFTINAGPGTRSSTGAWISDQARTLMRFVKQHNLPISVFEFANEPNAFPLFHGGLMVEPEALANDIKELARARDKECPGVRISAPATAWWPKIGEVPTPVLGVRPFLMRDYLQRVVAAASCLDIVSWHYYPGLSDRSKLALYYDRSVWLAFAPIVVAVACLGRTPWPVTLMIWLVMFVIVALVLLVRKLVRPIRLKTLRTASNLDTVAKLGSTVQDIVARVTSTAEKHAGPDIWLGETGSAQVGGQAGVSGRWAATLWWLDQLAVLAVRGHKVQCRQTLCGHADSYALIDDATMEPLPDYWASVLWKKLMGTEVYAVTTHPEPTTTESIAGEANVRVYCHSPSSQAWAAAGEPSGAGFLLLAINLGEKPFELDLGSGQLVATWLLTAPSLSSRTVTINGTAPSIAVINSSIVGDLEAPAVVPAGAALFALTRNLRKFKAS